MYTIYDYLDYYKDLDFKELKWNDMDALMCSILAYLPITKIDKKTDIKDITINGTKGSMAEAAFLVLSNISDSKRYSNMYIKDIAYVKNKEIQFKAMTILINNMKIVSFMGTDGSIVGWKENFNISFEYPTKTQREAIEYINNENNVDYIVGHSKGGNLAIVSGMELKDKDKLKKIYNFDGPGLKNEEYNSKKYKEIKDMITTFIPEESMVGVLMNNDNYYVVDANKHGYSQHKLYNWYCFGTMLLKANLTENSRVIHDNTISALKSFDQDEVKLLIEEVFRLIRNNNITEWKDLNKMDFKDIRNVIYGLEIKDYVKTYYIELFKMLMQ